MLLHRFVSPSGSSAQRFVLRTPAPDDLVRLRAAVGPPLVTITVATEPAATGMSAEEAFRLADAVADVDRRSRRVLGVHDAVRLADRCRRLAVDVVDEATGWGVALFVAPDSVTALRLAVAPIERSVVGAAFVVDDLERSLRDRPPAVVVRVGVVGTDVLVVDDGIAVPLEERAGPPPPTRPGALGRWAHQVAWSAEQEAGPRRAPVVVVGEQVPVDAVCRHLVAPPLMVRAVDGRPDDDELVELVRGARHGCARPLVGAA